MNIEWGMWPRSSGDAYKPDNFREQRPALRAAFAAGANEAMRGVRDAREVFLVQSTLESLRYAIAKAQPVSREEG